MIYKDWPNQVRKIWYGKNQYGFNEAQHLTNELGFNMIFDKDLQPSLIKL